MKKYWQLEILYVKWQFVSSVSKIVYSSFSVMAFGSTRWRHYWNCWLRPLDHYIFSQSYTSLVLWQPTTFSGWKIVLWINKHNMWFMTQFKQDEKWFVCRDSSQHKLIWNKVQWGIPEAMLLKLFITQEGERNTWGRYREVFFLSINF